jgi:ribonucleoside-diphosphate reductase alpha chain
LKFLKDGKFDYEAFQKVVRVFVIAQDILIDRASYPLKDIARNAHRCRQIGLGFTNLGALLMSMGLAYDSDEGRNLAANIASTMTARAYLTSAELADSLGAFEEYDKNMVEMHEVLEKHRDAANGLKSQDLWKLVCEKPYFRNCQTTLSAPTGTISFLMDCDTTGIEPELALVKTKTLVGGGTIKMANKSVEAGLESLGINKQLRESILDYITRNETLAGDEYLTAEELKVFETSLGNNAMSWQAHVKMLASVQPFLSAGISKTINMPTNSTVEDIQAAYMMGWKLGLKSMAIYRDGSKGYQPLNIKKEFLPTSIRNRLPDTRESITHKFTIDGHKGYFTVGLYPNGQPGELFISVAKEGSTLGGIFDCFGLATSIGLQYGVPLSEFIDKFTHVRFEPMGFTKNKDIKIAKSIIDYIFRWLAFRFTAKIPVDVNSPTVNTLAVNTLAVNTLDAPICDNCGQLCVRVGSCYLCYSCGSSGGCS